METEITLFGEWEIKPNGKRGRPKHEATDENRNRIVMFLSFGWTNERIAGALDITQPTMRRYYFSELKLRDVANDRLKAARFSMLFSQMGKGNIGAHREFDRLAEREMVMLANSRFEAPEQNVPQLGKKEQQKIEADEAGLNSSWGDDLQSGIQSKH